MATVVPTWTVREGHYYSLLLLYKILLKTDSLIDRLPLLPSAGDTKGIEDMDMNAVRLCFQCELEWDDGRKNCLNPVLSNPIYDKSETLQNTHHGVLTALDQLHVTS